MVSPDAELSTLEFLKPKEVLALTAAGMRRLGDLLDHLPRRYEDRRRFDSFPATGGGEPMCIRGMVLDVRKRFGGRARFLEAVISDSSGRAGMGPATVTCRWFNMPYLSNVLAAGQDVILHGKPKEIQGRIYFDHPEFEVIKEGDGSSIHLERIVPIYRNIPGIHQKRLREILHESLTEVNPDELCVSHETDPTYPRHEAYREVHFPESFEHAEAARRYFALDEFFKLQLKVVWRRAQHRRREGRILGKRMALLREFHEALPFELTEAQKRSIREIIGDMREPHPMNRLLQGDVGSGKTFVAMAAMLLAVDSGVQAALMAPTQILAEQHFLTFQKWLEPLGVRVALRTADRREGTHMELEGDAQILIGTHALLYDDELFADLGLVVIDEQHKFGVMQRGKLVERGKTPDVLVMTATPIPRTLTMTVHGDLDVSILDERPPGRGKMVTALRVKPKQAEVTKFVKEQLDSGRQAYLVYPLVEESDALKVESATAAHERWAKRLAKYEVGLLHGKLGPDEKEEVMKLFREGDTDVLVCTSVIEVGVDVANANLMIIHHAERFGLAQLHQLRGRIGRGAHTSYCVLLSDGKSEEGMEKLGVMEKTSDGFVIAEEDLRLRGPGDVLGTMQSGLGEFRFPDFLADTALIREARALAESVIEEDPGLNKKHQALAGLMDELPNRPMDRV